jgi:hypothetical protein
MNTHNRSAFLMLLLASAFAPHTADALQLRLTPDQLCGLSDAVVHGEVTDLETFWAPGEQAQIERRAWLDVHGVAHGARLQGAEVILPGGEIGSLKHWVEDVPQLEVGATYLLFLQRDAENKGYRIIGGDEGAVRIAPGDVGQGVKLDDALSALGVCDAG